MKKFFQYISEKYYYLFSRINKFIAPIWDLLARVCLFDVFFHSGWLKLANAINGNWYITIFLFKYEHPIPYIPASIAAALGTFNEVFFGALILLGLFSRFSALVLLIMSIIIEFTYMHSPDHYLWIFLLSSVLIRGGGKLSMDYLLELFFFKNYRKKYYKDVE